MKKFKSLLKHLTVFDLVFFFVVITMALSVFVFFKRQVKMVEIRVKVTDHDVLYAKKNPWNWYAGEIVSGDMEKDSLGRPLSEIVGVEKFNTSPTEKAVYVDMKVKAVYDKRKGTYSARGKNLVFGAPMRFNFSKVVFDGIVTEFPGSDSQSDLKISTASVHIIGRGVEKKLAESIKAGDKIVNSNGTLLAEVKEVRLTPAERVVTNDRGDLLLRYDPLFVDMNGEVVLRTKTINGETYVFDDLPLKVGEALPLNFYHVSLYPMVTDFKLNDK